MITAKHATPMQRLATLVPPASTAFAVVSVDSHTPDASTSMPNSFGNWLSNSVSAMPFMKP